MGIIEIEDEKIKFVNLRELYINNVYNLKEEKKEDRGYSKIVENPTYANLLTRVEFLMREPIAPMKKIDIINWITSYNMPADLIEEAFFYTTEIKAYVDAILMRWKDLNINSVEEIEEKDQKKKPTAFHNFKQITDKYSEEELNDVAMRKQKEGFKKLGVDYGTYHKDK